MLVQRERRNGEAFDGDKKLCNALRQPPLEEVALPKLGRCSHNFPGGRSPRSSYRLDAVLGGL